MPRDASHFPLSKKDASTLSVSLFLFQIGGLNGFIHSFISEVMAICRAHVAALGGNALVAYTMAECVLDDHLHKNQVRAGGFAYFQWGCKSYFMSLIKFLYALFSKISEGTTIPEHQFVD